MLASKLFQMLSRTEVQEIVLLVGKPPCALVDGAYRRLSSNLLREEDVMIVLASAQGQHHLARLADGCRWEFQLPSVGSIQVSAIYDGPILKASLKLLAAAVQSIDEHELIEDELELAEVPPARATHAGAARKKRSSRPPPAQPVPVRAAAPAENYGSEQTFEALHHPAEYAAPAASALDLARISSPVRAPARMSHAGDVLEQLLGRARQLHASDVHLLADRPPMLRIAGELVPQPEVVSAAMAEQLLLPRVPEVLRAQLQEQGSCDFPLVHSQYGRFRANVCLQRSGWKLTARPIGETVPTLAELGLPESIANALHHHQGLIVITGATGSGKTTTLAALVGMLNRDTSHHVITVEDPIEYVHEVAQATISQREVGKHTKSFAAALKGSLREDPDVIVVGELRDTETVRMALSASETGHLVISTMNTPSAAKAIERLIDLFPPGDQPQVRMTLAGGLRMIVSQRLLPSADRTQLCAAAEVLPGSTPLWSLIRENRTFQIPSLQQRGKSLGIIRIDDSLAHLVKTNRTTLEIAREYCDSAEQLDSIIKGRPAVPRPDAAENTNDPNNMQKLGKQVMSRAGKLFGGENK